MQVFYLDTETRRHSPIYPKLPTVTQREHLQLTTRIYLDMALIRLLRVWVVLGGVSVSTDIVFVACVHLVGLFGACGVRHWRW
jgi:hypothetical protein